jgi:hypothetical protein
MDAATPLSIDSKPISSEETVEGEVEAEVEAEAAAARLGCTSAWSIFGGPESDGDLTRLRKLGLLGLWALKNTTSMAVRTAELGVTVRHPTSENFTARSYVPARADRYAPRALGQNGCSSYSAVPLTEDRRATLRALRCASRRWDLDWANGR